MSWERSTSGGFGTECVDGIKALVDGTPILSSSTPGPPFATPPDTGFGEANDPKKRDALARALPQAQVPLARGRAREGVPLSVGNIKAIGRKSK